MTDFFTAADIETARAMSDADPGFCMPEFPWVGNWDARFSCFSPVFALCERHDWPMPSEAEMWFIEACAESLQLRLEQAIQRRP